MPLTRAQASSFLLPKLDPSRPTPHLSLSTDLSFVEGNQQAIQQQYQQQLQQQQSIASHASSSSQPQLPPAQLGATPRRRSSLGPNPPQTSASSTASLHGAGRNNQLGPHPEDTNPPPPVTPSPFPQTRKADVAFGEAVGVPLASYTFGTDPGKGKDGKGKGRETDKAWVGKEEGGGWVGVWRFGGEVGKLRGRGRGTGG